MILCSTSDYSYRVVVVSANGRHFSVGLDLKGESLAEDAEQDVGKLIMKPHILSEAALLL